MIEVWIFVGAGITGFIGGVFIRRWMKKLTPIQKYAKMANRARTHDKAAWERFEKDIYKKCKERDKKGLTSIIF